MVGAYVICPCAIHLRRARPEGGVGGGARPGPPASFRIVRSRNDTEGAVRPPESTRSAKFFWGLIFTPGILGLFFAPGISNSGKGIRVCNLIRVNELGF